MASERLTACVREPPDYSNAQRLSLREPNIITTASGAAMTERERIEQQNRIDLTKHSIKNWKARRARYRRDLQSAEDKLSRAQAYGYRHKLAEAQADIPVLVARIKSTSFYIDLWERQLNEMISEQRRPPEVRDGD